MHVRVSTLVRWAAIAAAAYVTTLGLWRVLEPVYMHALAVFIGVFDAGSLLPTSIQAIVVQGRGLVVMGAGLEPIATPQRIIGADVALVVALMVAAAWLPWRQRARRLPLALALVFAAHLATLVAQTWVNSATSTSLWAVWNLWTTLYQGKVVPLAVWCFLVAPPFLLETRPRLRPASAGHVR